jgi:hypothetical protein
MPKGPIISRSLLFLALAFPGIAPGAQQTAPVAPTKHQPAEKPLVDQVLVELTPDTEKIVLKCYSDFETSTDKLQFSDLNSPYGTVRGLQQSLDALRDLIDSEKKLIPISSNGAGLDPLFAMDLLSTTHRASTQSLTYALLPNNQSKPELRDGLAKAYATCSAAHDSLVDYVKASMALR